MSGEPQGLASFPGVDQLIQASITLSAGIQPSAATLVIAPQVAAPAEVGPLALAFGAVAIEFLDCKLDRGRLQRTATGEIWRVTLLDRRWKWQFGSISGCYNLRRDDASLQDGGDGAIDTERTPRELATLCFEAMGEADYSVAALPNDLRPSAEWDRVVPAQALASLCAQLGCEVVLRLDGSACICKTGEGADLPAGPYLESSLAFDLPDVPDNIAVIGGASRFQVDFLLEAVGLEVGGTAATETYIPIDELSYAPAGGWSSVDVPYFNQVTARWRPLAQKSAFRYYRIQTPVAIPGYSGPDGNVVSRLEQLLPIEAEQVATDTEGGQVVNRPAMVFGVWFPEHDIVANSAPELTPLFNPPQSLGDTSDKTIYQGGFQIDTARGLVIFDEPVYRNTHVSASGGAGYELVPGPAQLVLRTACSVRDLEKLACERYRRVRDTGSEQGTQDRELWHDELVLTHVPTYASDYSLTSVATNATPVHAAADRYLDLAADEYQARQPRTARYPGLVPIELDGAIRQVTYHVGAPAATTSACLHHELSTARKSKRRALWLERALATLTPRGLARAWKTNIHARVRPRT